MYADHYLPSLNSSLIFTTDIENLPSSHHHIQTSSGTRRFRESEQPEARSNGVGEYVFPNRGAGVAHLGEAHQGKPPLVFFAIFSKNFFALKNFVKNDINLS
jgi:hypothetical protein